MITPGRRAVRRAVGAWCAFGLWGGAALAAQPDEAVRPDPAWTLRSLDGGTFTLADLRGRPVFINLWATWCPPCVAELASIDGLAAAVGDEVAFLLVSPEDEAPVRAFLRRHELGVEPVLEVTLAPDALGAVALPHTVVLDADGRVVLRHRGAADWNTSEVTALLEHLAATASPEPAFRLEAPEGGRSDRWGVRVAIPEGWRLYAPDAADLGRPLAARWTVAGGSSVPAGLVGPPSIPEETAAGPVAVYRGSVELSVGAPPPGARGLEISWALCRDDLCVPGRTTVPVGRR